MFILNFEVMTDESLRDHKQELNHRLPTWLVTGNHERNVWCLSVLLCAFPVTSPFTQRQEKHLWRPYVNAAFVSVITPPVSNIRPWARVGPAKTQIWPTRQKVWRVALWEVKNINVKVTCVICNYSVTAVQSGWWATTTFSFISPFFSYSLSPENHTDTFLVLQQRLFSMWKN